MRNRLLRVLTLAIFVLGNALALPQVSFAQTAAPAGPVLTQPVHPLAPAPAPAVPAVPTAAVTPASQPAAAAEQFDGPKLYQAAFEKIRELHITLSDKDKVEAFTKEWEHKFDNTGDLQSEKGTDKAILKMLQSLGQRFDYSFDKQATQAEADEVDATLTGIGATLKLSKLAEIIKGLPKDSKSDAIKKAIAISKDNDLVVDEPLEGGPAEKAGVKPGDIIRKVNDQDLTGMQMTDAIKLIKGAAGTDVKLALERTNDQGKTDTLDITVTRARVTVPDVKYRDLGQGMSYVKLRDFMSKNAMREMRDGLLKASKGKGLILDLRGNPGGSLPAVLTIVGMMLEDGPVLVTRSRNGDQIVESEISLNKNFVLRIEPDQEAPSVEPRPKLIIPNDMPVIVLVDEGSASASEILSGVLQHNHRAIIVGMPTVGKGVGQTVVKLPFGRSLHITSFEFIPGRTPNNWIGVIPNVKQERGNDPKVDKQLDRAKELLSTMIKAAEENKAQRDELLKKNHEDFEKQLQERNKN